MAERFCLHASILTARACWRVDYKSSCWSFAMELQELQISLQISDLSGVCAGLVYIWNCRRDILRIPFGYLEIKNLVFVHPKAAKSAANI